MRNRREDTLMITTPDDTCPGTRVSSVVPGASKLQTNKLPVKERLIGWPSGGGYGRDTARLLKGRDPNWLLAMSTRAVSRTQSSEMADHGNRQSDNGKGLKIRQPMNPNFVQVYSDA